MDYTALAMTVKGLLAQHGQDVVLRNIVAGTGNPDGTVSGGGPVDITRRAALFDFREGQTNGPGGLIQGGDKSMLMEAGVVPALEDHVIVDSVEYTIIGIASDNPAGIPLDYSLHLRT